MDSDGTTDMFDLVFCFIGWIWKFIMDKSGYVFVFLFTYFLFNGAQGDILWIDDGDNVFSFQTDAHGGKYDDNNWYLDSGCTRHMTKSSHWLTNVVKTRYKVWGSLQVKPSDTCSSGNLNVICPVYGSRMPIVDTSKKSHFHIRHS